MGNAVIDYLLAQKDGYLFVVRNLRNAKSTYIQNRIEKLEQQKDEAESNSRLSSVFDGGSDSTRS
jgi:hypothetical protein